MKSCVLDAHALLAFLQDEAGAEKVERALLDAAQKERPLRMASVNWGEVRYRLLRDRGADVCEEKMGMLSRLPIQVVEVDRSMAEEAANIKAEFGLPYADCFGAALARHAKAPLLTGDPHFKAVEKIVKVEWVR